MEGKERRIQAAVWLIDYVDCGASGLAYFTSGESRASAWVEAALAFATCRFESYIEGVFDTHQTHAATWQLR